MSKTIKHIFLLFLLMMFLSSCNKEINEYELALCGSYAVPGMFCYDLKGGSYECSILEQDRYGRIMFQYSTNSVITNKKETAIIICQAIDSEYVYFYEDICYIVLDDPDQDISKLKELNDWNRAEGNSKMSYRKNHISYDRVIQTDSMLDYQNVRASICEKVNIFESQIREFCILDEDYAGNELYFLRTIKNETFILLIQKNYNIAVLKIDGHQSVQANLTEFKAENGWNYGIKPVYAE